MKKKRIKRRGKEEVKISKDKILWGKTQFNVVKEDKCPQLTNDEFECIYYEITKDLFNNIKTKDFEISSDSKEIKLSKDIPYLITA